MAEIMNSVERALRILEFVAEHGQGLTNSDISRRLSIPKSSASYLLRTLEGRGYLRREPGSGRYRIGLKVLGLGQTAMDGMDLGRIALPILRQLVEGTRLTAHVAILDHGRAVYVQRAENPGFIKINTWVGRDLPVHSTSVGKVLVCGLPHGELEAILDREGLERKTPRTITDRAKFYDELHRVRERGYAVDDEENNLGVRCLAVPVLDGSGDIGAALGVSGATSQVSLESIPGLVEVVTKAALNVSSQLGYQS